MSLDDHPAGLPGNERLTTHGRYDSPAPDAASFVWPGGKRLALYIAVGVEDYRFGNGHVEDLLPGIPDPDLVNASWRDYGNRVGAFRLLQRLERYQITPTILLNTAVYDSAPQLITEIRRIGGEIVGHGVTNSDSLDRLGESDERKYLQTVAQRIMLEEGVPPLGWSSPWLTHTHNTFDLLAETGYRYLLDIRPDDQPVALKTRSGTLLAIPYSLELNDSTSIIGRGVGAAEFADMIIDEFDELLLAARDQPLVMSIVVHSFISGVPFRLRQLTRALEHIAQSSDAVWLTTPREIYRYFHAQASGASPAPDPPQ